MSCSLRCLRSSIPSTASSSRCITGTRGYAQAVLRARNEVEQTPSDPSSSRSSSKSYRPHVQGFSSTGTRKDSVWGSREKYGEVAQPIPMWKIKPEPHFANHLNALFEPLQFNPEVARRCLTHGSHPTSVNGHNAGMSFLGRRILESYLLLFLSSSRNLKPTHDLSFITNWTLNTYTLGQYVGSKWGLGCAMRWVPTVNKEKLAEPGEKDSLLQSVGLYKVQGDAVAAVMGAIYEQFGASVAHRAFHTRLLPHLLLDGKNGGLPVVFHDEVREICQRMGGEEADLTRPASTTKTEQEDSSKESNTSNENST